MWSKPAQKGRGKGAAAVAGAAGNIRSSGSGAGALAVRTSESHPITASWIIESEDPSKDQLTKLGGLALCFCPGKQVTRGGVTHERSLEADLAELKRRYGITCVACLLNQAELRSFKLRDYDARVEKAGLKLLSFPIIEMAPPESMEAAAAFVEQLVGLMFQGQCVAMHCRGGVGRAGLMAACVLLRLGISDNAEQAIAMVRERRCKEAVETSKQEDFVRAYARHLVQVAAQELEAGKPS